MVIDKVEALLREVAAAVVIPRFRQLAEDEIQHKGPGDLVTVADREAETWLTRELIEILPGSRVVGEEATTVDIELLSVVGQPGAVWLVDPVDGTTNFAAGHEPFAMMVALVRDTAPVAAWILNPLTGVAAVAERGSGAYVDGVRITVSSTQRLPDELRGAVPAHYLPEEVKRGLDVTRRMVGTMLPGRNCAGYEYPAIVLDEQQFTFFWRTLPWDHAPGVLFVEEAGGVAWRLDGTPYLPADPRSGLLIAQNQQVWDTVRMTLLADVPD